MDFRPRLNSIAVIVLAGFAIYLVASWIALYRAPALHYSELSALIQKDQVASIEVRPHALLVRLKQPKNGKLEFLTERVDLTLANELDKHGIHYYATEDHDDTWSWLLWAALPIAALIMLRGTMSAGVSTRSDPLSIAKSKARVYVETNTSVTFRDVAGVDESKLELQEIVEYLRNPAELGRLGARMPKGVLLVGPPGTGKTLLARAVAGEAGVPFYSINGSEFVELFVGVGAARVRDLFAQARSRAPSIIFIDELDALGRARNAMPYMGGHDEKEQTLNQLLSELDGFDASSGLVLLAATNRPEILDPALLRSGRFDRQVLVDRPDRRGRAEILAIHTRKLKCAPSLSLDDVAALTPGFTGADLSNLCNEAALTATRRGASDVQLEDFSQAVERIVAGLEKKHRLLHPLERKVVAYHETGHALVGSVLLQGERIQKVSIIPRGIGALGYTLQRPLEDRYLMTRDELENKLAVLMGGRAAEQLMLGRLSTGAADDLAKATELARSMATRYGMVSQLGHMAYDLEPPTLLGAPSYPGQNRTYSELSAQKVETAVKDILDRAFDKARAILTNNRSILEATASKLLERETLSERELQELLGAAQLPGNGKALAADAESLTAAPS